MGVGLGPTGQQGLRTEPWTASGHQSQHNPSPMLMSPHTDLGGPLGLRLLGEGSGVPEEGGSAGWTASWAERQDGEARESRKDPEQDPE